MKWFILINNAMFMPEFFGKLTHEIVKQGDDCIVVFSSKIAEYDKNKFFPKEAKFISRVNWCLENYKQDKKDFGNLSWKELFPIFDRFKGVDFGFSNSFKMVSETYQFFEFIFQKERPNVVISELPAGLFHHIAYYFSQKNNVPYLGFGVSRIFKRIDVLDAKFTCSKYEKNFNKINYSGLSKPEKDFASNIVEQFISHKKLPSYVGLSKINFSQIGILNHFFSRTKKISALLLKYISQRKYFKNFDYESEAILNNAISSLLRAERRKFRIFFQKHIFNNFNKTEKFFLFPLHLQPEASTSVYATYYCDQLNTIKNVAFSIPFPYKLYVKEHPVAVGTRPKSFYNKLKEIPNVVLISPYENVENLIKNSSGVIALTSTVGLEAVLSGKPAYIFGSVFYSYHPLCRSPKNFEELKNEIEKDLVLKPDTKELAEINSRFIISYFKNTIKGSIVSASEIEDENSYESIYQDIKRYFLTPIDT